MVDVYSWFETSSCIERSVMMPTTEKLRSKQTDQPHGFFFPQDCYVRASSVAREDWQQQMQVYFTNL